jgi:hypothetical protein
MKVFIFFLSLSIYGIASTSCNNSNKDKLSSINRAIDRAHRYDLFGHADSAVIILDSLFVSNNSEMFDDYTKLVYCRSLSGSGSTYKADSMYRIFIPEMKDDPVKGAMIGQYVILLAVNRQYDRACQYADTLVSKYSDSTGIYQDQRLLCYVARSHMHKQCDTMKIYLDSLKYKVGMIDKRLVGESIIHDWSVLYKKLCSY